MNSLLLSSTHSLRTTILPITRILHFEAPGFLFVLAAVVAFQLLTGRISLMGMLQQKDGSGQTSPERIQRLLATLAASARYLAEASSSSSGNLPDISNNWLYLKQRHLCAA